jgi:hypothetical protein
MRVLLWGGLLAALCLFPGTAARPQEKSGGEKQIDLQVVKYDRLAQEVLKHRGKVVVIDMWQFT